MAGDAHSVRGPMTPDELKNLLERVQDGSLSLSAAFSALERLPFSELGFAKVDHHRALRLGFPEVVLGEGKRADQIVGIARRLLEAGENVFVTRVSETLAADVLRELPDLRYAALARTLSY